DFQKSTLGNVAIDKADTVWLWRLVSIPLESANNVLVDSVYLEDPFVVGGQRNTLNVRLRDIGTKAYEGLIVKLTVNDLQSGTAAVNLEPHATAIVKFDLVQGLKGWNKAVISFTDFPVSFDNEFYVTLNFSEKIKVVEVRNNNAFIEKVFGNSALFSYRGFGQGNVDPGVLAQADLVILNNIENPDAALTGAIRNYQKGPGAVLIIPSARNNLNSYLPILTGLTSSGVDGLELAELDKPDFQNPFFENVFEEKSTSLAMPRAKPVWGWANDRSSLLKFKDGRPFLSRIGKTFVLASPLDPKFSDFQNHALFVPVMYRIAASGRRIGQKLYYSLTETTITLVADSISGETPMTLKGKQEVVPAQRKNGDRIFLEIPKFTIDAGFYYAMVKQDTLGLVAFDLDQRESLLAQWTGEDIQSMLGSIKTVSLFNAATTDSFSNEIKERYLGTPLWKYALIAALIFLLAEVLLIRFVK
ncbi:MAG TPA: hypothetical protein PLR06_13015, partial [Cyclobacteriaceae bacterium]|nr:hypothetical protein [Cyclobacteriaceae bacterium]